MMSLLCTDSDQVREMDFCLAARRITSSRSTFIIGAWWEREGFEQFFLGLIGMTLFTGSITLWKMEYVPGSVV